MGLIDNDFTIPNGYTQYSNNHPHLHLHHHQQQVADHFSMSYLQTPPPHPSSSHHHLPPPFQQPFMPTPEMCHKKLDKTGGRKRKRSGDSEVEGLKPSDVIHVRAKRGQATDSHSLAERVRRKKINEKLKSLHDIVPGCHKTMGMAVMLDVVIKYIQSLQNQIEFLSMKLLAASLFHDLNSTDMDVVETVQGPPPSAEVQEMERIVAEGYGGGVGAPYLNSTLFPLENFQNNQ